MYYIQEENNMNIFLRIGNAIENIREYKESLDRLSKSLDTFRCNCDFEEAYNLADNRYTSLRWNGRDKWIRSDFYLPPRKIDVNKIPSRLKFSVGHNHITIIVGNPVTYCKNNNQYTFTHGHGISVCNPIDNYDWKIGAIVALENLCDACRYEKPFRKQLFDKLFSKYPELRSK
jgi:hypothetical protein